MQGMPQLFNLINPRTVDWLEQQNKLGILLQPCLCFLTLVNDVIIHDQRYRLRLSVCSSQVSH